MARMPKDPNAELTKAQSEAIDYLMDKGLIDTRPQNQGEFTQLIDSNSDFVKQLGLRDVSEKQKELLQKTHPEWNEDIFVGMTRSAASAIIAKDQAERTAAYKERLDNEPATEAQKNLLINIGLKVDENMTRGQFTQLLNEPENRAKVNQIEITEKQVAAFERYNLGTPPATMVEAKERLDEYFRSPASEEGKKQARSFLEAMGRPINEEMLANLTNSGLAKLRSQFVKENSGQTVSVEQVATYGPRLQAYCKEHDIDPSAMTVSQLRDFFKQEITSNQRELLNAIQEHHGIDTSEIKTGIEFRKFMGEHPGITDPLPATPAQLATAIEKGIIEEGQTPTRGELDELYRQAREAAKEISEPEPQPSELDHVDTNVDNVAPDSPDDVTYDEPDMDNRDVDDQEIIF